MIKVSELRYAIDYAEQPPPGPKPGSNYQHGLELQQEELLFRPRQQLFI